jgi:uncharacterized membrane protein YeaQ/YmgE (transglycosylase-associated protein family)
MILEIVSWIIVGFITGSLARVVMPGPAAGGLRVAVLIGVFAALTGGYVGTAMPAATPGSFNWLSWGMAINGALYCLFIYRCVSIRCREQVVDREASSYREIVQSLPIHTASIDFGKL